MDIYIKPVKKYRAEEKKIIYIKDIAEVYSKDFSSEKIGGIPVFKIESDKRKNYVISVMEIIKAISNREPNATVVNVGEMDILIEFSSVHKESKPLIVWSKIIVVCVILFFGAATAIMSFHADGEIPEIMQNYYYMFFGVENEKPLILQIPYSIGLALGIIIFFNHFSSLKLTNDPTPIEVEMTSYEKGVIDNQVETLNKKKGKHDGYN
ncbi:MAG: stage V sporulation protein AA [Anaerotignaceae bacterium]